MKMKKVFLHRCLAFILSCISVQTYAETMNYIDLSHEMSEKTLHWPGSKPFKVTGFIAEKTPENLYFSVRDFATSEHVGTHLDAPNHFAKGHVGVNKILISQLIGPAIKIDISQEVKNNPDYQIGIKDFEAWEKQHGKIPNNTIVLLSTGYGKHWPNWEKYAGTIKKDAASLGHLHFPGLEPEAAIWLIKERKIKAVGIDTFSIDYGQTKKFETHQVLAKNDIPIFENVASMEKLPPNNFIVYAFPMKIMDGTGAPLRLVAQLEK